jgi:hypothetical protein
MAWLAAMMTPTTMCPMFFALMVLLLGECPRRDRGVPPGSRATVHAVAMGAPPH